MVYYVIILQIDDDVRKKHEFKKNPCFFLNSCK